MVVAVCVGKLLANIMNKHGPDGHKKMQDFDQCVVMLRASGCEALDRLSEADVE